MAKVFKGSIPKLSATIEVVDERESVLATGQFATDKAVRGYAQSSVEMARAGLDDRGQQQSESSIGTTAADRR